MTEILQAIIDENTAASHVLVAAESGNRVLVKGVYLRAAGTVTVTFEDDVGANLMWPLDFAAREQLEWFPLTGLYTSYFESTRNQGVNMLLGGAIQVSGVLWYSKANVS